MKDRAYYLGVLGVSFRATPEEVRLAYLDLVKVWHPDRFSHDLRLRRKAQEKLADINEAFEWIKANPLRGSEASGSARASQPARERPRPAPEQKAPATAPQTAGTAPPHWVAPVRINRWAWMVALVALVVWRSLATNQDQPTRPAPEAPATLPVYPDSESSRESSHVIGRDRSNASDTPEHSPNFETGQSSARGSDGLPERATTEPHGDPIAPESLRDSKIAPRRTDISGYFKVGSTRDEVWAAQGTPTEFGESFLKYGSSTVYLRDGKVTSWDIRPDSPLNAVMLSSGPGHRPGYFTVGSTKDEVLAAQGTPAEFSESSWKYGSSTVHFQNGRVTSWNILPDSPLNAEMLPSGPGPYDQGYFTVGSTKDEVLAAQGTPTELGESFWKYGSSTVYFRDGKVSSWNIWPGSPLSVRTPRK
jgi:curved DNA-binding protein CbpA